jgi:hypothetical protein
MAGVAGLQFIPVELAAAAGPDGRREALVHGGEEIHIELRRGAAQLAVRWPASQSCVCASWLGELARAVLK